MKYTDLIIISGGQTGVDRAALDFAMEHNIMHGGFCPTGRIAEDEKIPDHYSLIEIPESTYSYRTKLNIFQSDGTLIVFSKEIMGGTLYTFKVCLEAETPVFLVDINIDNKNIKPINKWLKEYKVNIINIAGSRESECPGIFNHTKYLLNRLLIF